MGEALNITNFWNQLPTEKYPGQSMIFPNKTLIVIARKYSPSSSQQMALLAGMAFVGGIVAGLLIRCIYFGIIKYFMSSVDQLTAERPTRANVNPSFVDDSYRDPNDQPPDYIAVMAEPPTNPDLQQQRSSKTTEELEESKMYEELPPNYKSIVSDSSNPERSLSI